ncbi:MAG: SDR family oxidoreductase [Clostridia bacterium]|nr:SDR family oxidoreductase [Clostridia bacterium]
MKNNLFSLEGKVAIITGGYRGIGKSVAKSLADAGADIVIWDLIDATEVAKEISEEFGVRATALVCDVTSPEAVEKAVADSAAAMGTLDILFNNAGIGPHTPALELTPADWQKVMNVNLNGVFYVAVTFAKYLIAQNKGGSIINTASMSGLIVNIPQSHTHYNSSKAAVIHMTKSLAVEWAGKGIRVNSISPGYIATDMIKEVRQDWKDAWVSKIPFGRMGTPEELGGAVIYLASDASTYTSGSNIVIDGCYTVV